MTSSFSWIKTDETAKEALARILTQRPFILLPPPLHRLPFRAGNVVEIVGPSPSAKTLLVTQAAINCILPKEWKGIQYGGLERPVLFVDLDCRFDVLSLSRALERRIAGSNGFKDKAMRYEKEYDKDLFAACLRRFLYVRCYSSSEFLATLKSMHYRLQKEETQTSGIYMLIIDSIGAFYWMDRALPPRPPSSSGSINRRSLTLQTVADTIVQEIKQLLVVHPMLVLATKSSLFGDNALGGLRKPRHREYMPSVWQSFVTHRILLQASDGNGKHQNHPVFLAEWLLPSVKFSDNFIVNNDGLLAVL